VVHCKCTHSLPLPWQSLCIQYQQHDYDESIVFSQADQYYHSDEIKPCGFIIWQCTTNHASIVEWHDPGHDQRVFFSSFLKLNDLEGPYGHTCTSVTFYFNKINHQVGLFIFIMPGTLTMSALHLQNIREAFAEHSRNVCRTFANHLREDRASAARNDRGSYANVARNEGCYFWTPL
jgi:hypothetical protein